MANDPLRFVTAGQRIDKSAARENALTEAARWVRRHKNDGGDGEQPADSVVPSLTVLVRNDTGADLDEFSVLRLTDWVVSPVDYPFDVQEKPIFAGATPNASTNLIVITQEPILSGSIGEACISGHAVVDVLVNSGSHEYAAPINGDNTRLTSVTSGAARIIKIESSGTTRRALVLLGSEGGRFTAEETDGTPATTTRLKFPTTALTDNGDGTVTVNVATATLAGILSQTGQTIGGYKIFADGIESSLGLEVNNGTATINTDLYVHGVGSQFTIDDYAGSPANLTLLCRATGLYPGGNVFGPEIYATADDLNSTGVMKVVFDLLDTDRRFVIWDSGSMPKIVLTDGSTVAIGATGTLGPGATFVGGIANSVGSGTFFSSSDLDMGAW